MWIRKKNSLPWVAVMLVVVGNDAVANNQPVTVGEPRRATPPDSMPRDSELMTAVWNAIRADRVIDPSTIEVAADSGRVTLSGIQPALIERDRGTYLAETIAGVRQVDNRIIVQRGAREADAQKLESDVLYMLLTDPATARSNIVVAADADGRVTLSGTVGAYGERYLAGQLARTVAGVRQVTNRISLQAPSPIVDSNLEESIRLLLDRDAYIRDSGDIDVSARQGIVTLKGSLRTLAEKRRAVDLSSAAGARRVIADRLRATGATTRIPERMSASRRGRSDQAVMVAVRHALQSDPRLADCSIDLRADNGAVRLEGSVPTLAAQRAAIWLVRGIRGVQSIHADLRISDDAHVFSDEEILLRIERALMRNSLTRDNAFAVSVHDGTVLLEGEVRSWLARQFAENAAASILGVETIKNEIVIDERDGNAGVPQFAASGGIWWTPGVSTTTPVVMNAVAGASHP